MGLVADLQGAFSYKQLTEEFTIPQVQIMLKDKPYVKYGKSSKKDESINDAFGFLNAMRK